MNEDKERKFKAIEKAEEESLRPMLFKFCKEQVLNHYRYKNIHDENILLVVINNMCDHFIDNLDQIVNEAESILLLPEKHGDIDNKEQPFSDDEMITARRAKRYRGISDNKLAKMKKNMDFREFLYPQISETTENKKFKNLWKKYFSRTKIKVK